MSEPVFRFPDGFWWGAATAAHQVEGSLLNDWVDFERTPGAVRNGDTSLVGVDHYRRFHEDFRLAQEMGHNVHRLSLEWSRIQPTRDTWDREAIAHYHEVFAALRARGLEPLVTLHHFTNPTWIADCGGWQNERTIEDFAQYVGFVADEFPEVDWWITINEPNVYTFQSYSWGLWPPRRRNPYVSLEVFANLAQAHLRAYTTIHQVRHRSARSVHVGLAYHLYPFDPFAAWSPLDRKLAQASNRLFNQAFLEAVCTGNLDFAFPGMRLRKDLGSDSALDFLGINYYTRGRSRFPFPVWPAPRAPINDMGWEIYPEGFYQSLKIASEHTKLPDGRQVPLVITENGIADSRGDRRTRYLIQHLQQVVRGLAEGMDIRGYIHWTLMDNFEWSEGYAPRFGLYRIDREKDLERVPTPTVEIFRSIAAANALLADHINLYGDPG